MWVVHTCIIPVLVSEAEVLHLVYRCKYWYCLKTPSETNPNIVFLYFTYFVHMHAWCHVEVRGHLVGTGSSLSLYGSSESNSGLVERSTGLVERTISLGPRNNVWQAIWLTFYLVTLALWIGHHTCLPHAHMSTLHVCCLVCKSSFHCHSKLSEMNKFYKERGLLSLKFWMVGIQDQWSPEHWPWVRVSQQKSSNSSRITHGRKRLHL